MTSTTRQKNYSSAVAVPVAGVAGTPSGVGSFTYDYPLWGEKRLS